MPLSLLLPPLFIPALFVALPFLSSEQFFSIPVQRDWRLGPQARHIRQRYQATVLAIAALSASISVWAGANHRIVYSVAVFEVFAILGAWAWGWNQTLPFRIQHPVLRSASLGAPPRVGRAVGWTLAALLPLLGTTLYLATQYSHLPPSFAMHFAADGSPNHTVLRSPLTVFAPAMAGTAMIVLFCVLLYAAVRRSAGVADGGRYSALVHSLFIACAWYLSVEFSVVALLPAVAHPEGLASRILSVSSVCLLLLLLVASGYLFGQRRVLAEAQTATAEEHWRGGLWYFNRDDGALFVPKRIGFGYTLNMAHPEAWLLMNATLAVAVVPLLLKHL